MKLVYLSDLIDRAEGLRSLLLVLKRGGHDIAAERALLRAAHSDAQGISNTVARELCEQGVSL